MMKVNNREQDFVLRYFQTGKLDTQKALRLVRARLVSSSEAEKMPKTREVYLGRYRWMAVVASLLVLVAVGAYTLLLPKTVIFASDSEVMACHLPDGTQVTLSPHSSLSYQEDNCRRVKMEGCAYFQVKHDEQHSFEVNGERAHVRVLGTRFMVDERKREAVHVMVTSGKVFFSARDSKEGVLLVKGKQAQLLSGENKPQMLESYDVNDVAWATHQLHFDHAPLREVLQRLSEFNGGVTLTTANMNKCLTGDFSTDSLQQAIDVIEQTLEIKITSR